MGMSSSGQRNGIEWRTDEQGRRRYRGTVRSRKNGIRRNGPWVATQTEAKAWRLAELAALGSGAVARPSTLTIREQWAEFIDGAREGRIADRSGRPYKPATLRGYERCFARIDADLGAHKLSELRRADVQRLVDRLNARDLAPATVRKTLDPLRVLSRRALQRDELTVNPTLGLDLPRAEPEEIEVVPRSRAAELLAALQPADQTLWATALYAGLRRGELRALRWTDVDLQERVIHVTRSWDDVEGETAPKSRASRRRVPVTARLHGQLLAHRLATGRRGDDLVFGKTPGLPFEPTALRKRAGRVWTAAGLGPITLHACRHSFASYMIDAGANAKALSTVMGHASIQITFDRYGHLMPGSEREVGRLLDSYLG